MRQNEIIKRVTGNNLDLIEVNKNNPKIGDALWKAVNDLVLTETELLKAADRLTQIADTIRDNINPTGQRVASLNPLGELQHDRTDTLIALRAQQIDTINNLVALI